MRPLHIGDQGRIGGEGVWFFFGIAINDGQGKRLKKYGLIGGLLGATVYRFIGGTEN